MAIPKNLKKRMIDLIDDMERRTQKNRYFIFKEGEKRPEIPDKSLVIVMTDFPNEDEPEQATDETLEA